MIRAFIIRFCVIVAPILLGPAVGATENTQPQLQAGETVAFLGLTFLDTSAEGAYFGQKPEELARITLLEQRVRDRFAEAGLVLMDLTPVAEDLDRIVNPAKCYGCDVRMGAKLGADYVLVGEVQKVSNLILSMNLVLRDTATGRMVRGRSVDIRSNTDESWLRGINYILKTEMFKT